MLSNSSWHDGLVFLDSHGYFRLPRGQSGLQHPASSRADTKAKRRRQGWVSQMLIPSSRGLLGRAWGPESEFLTQAYADSLGQGSVPSLSLSFLIWEVVGVTPSLQASESTWRPPVVKMLNSTKEKDHIIQHIYTSNNSEQPGWCSSVVVHQPTNQEVIEQCLAYKRSITIRCDFIIPVYGAHVTSSALLHLASQPSKSEIMKPIFQRRQLRAREAR